MKTVPEIKVLTKDGRWISRPANSFDIDEYGKRLILHRYVRVKPTVAQVILNDNIKNRKISKKTSETYCRDMQNDNWHNTHQGIGFYEDGILSDGQHRLEAIVKSNKSRTLDCGFGIEYPSAISIDDVRKRTLADSTEISDEYSAIPLRILSASNWLDKNVQNKHSGRLSRTEKATYIKKHWVALVSGDRYCNKSANLAPIRAVLARLFYNVENYGLLGANRFEELIKVLNSEITNGAKDSAAIKLLQHVRGDKKSVTGNYLKDCYWKTEWCFHNFMMKKSVSRISKAKSEMFPLPEEKEEINME